MLWIKDDIKKEITIKTRNEFFAGHKIVDWTKRIDYSKENTITPLAFDYRFGTLGWAESAMARMQEYEERNNISYGSAKVDTGFEFNDKETKLMSEDSIFNAMVSMEYDSYFGGRNPDFPFRDDKMLPALFGVKDGKRDKLSEIMQLFFYNGLSDCKPYKLSDDTADMREKGIYCWSSLTNTTRYVYPRMSRIRSGGSKMYSLDFAKPNILYYPSDDNQYPSSSTIYSRFWRRYMNERLSSDTRVMNCYASITATEFSQWTFNTFVKINNTLWHVNKITNFDPTKEESVAVELVRVNDIDAYINSQDL